MSEFNDGERVIFAVDPEDGSRHKFKVDGYEEETGTIFEVIVNKVMYTHSTNVHYFRSKHVLPDTVDVRIIHAQKKIQIYVHFLAKL